MTGCPSLFPHIYSERELARIERQQLIDAVLLRVLWFGLGVWTAAVVNTLHSSGWL